MPFVTVQDGTRLYHEESGEGEPLLLVPGQGQDHTSWNGIRSDFTRRFRVIVYDPRGTGQSDKPSAPPYSTHGFAQDAIALLDHKETLMRGACDGPTRTAEYPVIGTPIWPAVDRQGALAKLR